MQNSNNLLEDLPREHQKRSNHEDISGPDSKKARNLNDGPSPPPAGSSNNVLLGRIENMSMVNQRNQSIHIDLCNDRSVHIQMNQPVHIQQIQVRNQVQPTTMMENSHLLPTGSSVNHPNHSITIDLCNDHPVVIQEPQISMQPTTSKDTSTLPARSYNDIFLQKIEPNQCIHIDLCNDHHPVVIQEPKIPHVKVEHAQNHMQPTTLEHSSTLPGGSSNNLFLQRIEPNQSIHIDLCNDHHGVHGHTQRPKKVCIEGEHVSDQVQTTTSTNSSLLPASSSNNLFKEGSINLTNQPDQNSHLIGTQMNRPVHIQEPQMPHVKVEHAQNHMQPTTSKHPSSLPSSFSNNLFVESKTPSVNKQNQNNSPIGTQMNRPVHIQEPKIPHVKVEHAQIDMQPTTSKHPSPQWWWWLPSSSSNNLFVESNSHSVNHPNQNNLPIGLQMNQSVNIQEFKIQVKIEHAQNHMQPSTSNHNYCEEIYHKLRAMFPNIDKEYIKTFCPANWIPEVSHEMQFNSIVDTIFMNKHTWVIDETPNTSLHDVQNDDLLGVPNVDDAYEQLIALFPNADSHYLRSAAEKFTNENDMTTFIEEKLKTRNYPTREEYLAKMKVTEEQQRYTTDFNVEQFLTLFPDPFQHFENDARKCAYSLIAVEFLKNIFNYLRVNTINKTYRLCKYNISITAKNLRKSTDYIACKRRAREIPTENIQLLQEMAFVRHHEKILQQIQPVKQREEEEFNLLKTLGGLYTCRCCFDEECMPSKCSTCDNGHIFCNSCIINGTDSKLADGETHVPCFLDCGSEFSIATFQKVLPPTKLCIFLKKRQAAEVAAAGLEGLVCCPFCDFASIPPEGDKVFKCFNPECMKESCIKCKEPNHVPYTCGDNKKRSEKARIYIEEKMTEALTRTCYKCKKTFFKEAGCNKMTCTCGASMCYICSQPVTHADGYRHFQGQGSDDVGKCPLWTDNAVLNSETVRKVEEEARKDVLRQDPSVNINTNVLAPAVQPSRPGPHVGVSNAHDLANTLAARVLNTSRFDSK